MKSTFYCRLLMVSACLILVTPSYATNGIYLIGYGAKSRAMGGVGIGYSQDAISNQLNPAGMPAYHTGAMRVDMGMMYFNPRATATIPDPRVGTPSQGDPIDYASHADQFLIPAMGMSYKFNRKVYMGFSFVGAGGGGTRYTRLGPEGFNFFNPVQNAEVGDTLGINFMQAQMAMTLAYKVNKRHTIAISPVIGLQTFRAFGLGVFKAVSADSDSLTNNGNDWAYGAGLRFGWQGKLHDRLTMGAVYTTKIYMTDFDKYAGLFAEQGSLDNPANVGLGFGLELSDKIVVAFDWMRVFYSDVAAIANPIEALKTVELGDDTGAGFGWNDQDIYKLGLKYKYNKKWDLMVGFNYGEVPMPEDQLLFSALAPAVTEKHATAGVTYRQNRNMEWTVAYVHAFTNREAGVANTGDKFNGFFPDGNTPIVGPGDMALEMAQDSIELSFTYKM